ncbi:MAG: acyl-CoA dehydrogenase family protein [Beijerinckiaceae bacterium]
MNTVATEGVLLNAPLRETFLERAQALAPKLRERSARCEEMRRLPEETIADYMDAGLIRVTQPHRYGGYELGWDVLCEVSQILAAACGSQAWIQRIMADHAMMVATFSDETQHDVWGKNINALVSASFDPVGVAKRVEGGFLFSGRHGFSSGVDYADWMICGGHIFDGDRKDGPHFFLVPRADATIIDDWRTMGLSGTGSKSFVVDNVFIPEHRFLDGKLSREGNGPGVAVNTAPVYRTPRGGGITATGFAALTVGMGRGVMQEWLAYTGTRKSRGVSVSGRQTTQMIAAEAAAELDAAELLFMTALRESVRKLEAGERISDQEKAASKRNVAFACKLALEAGTKLFNHAGGRALFVDGHMQRQYRNLLASASHHAVVWEEASVEYGATVLRLYQQPEGRA